MEDIALIENLEETKRTAVDIAEKVKQAKETEVSIGKAREVYRPVATRGSLVYFLIDTLNALDRCYHYSMANFVFILRKGNTSFNDLCQFMLSTRHVLLVLLVEFPVLHHFRVFHNHAKLYNFRKML